MRSLSPDFLSFSVEDDFTIVAIIITFSIWHTINILARKDAATSFMLAHVLVFPFPRNDAPRDTSLYSGSNRSPSDRVRPDSYRSYSGGGIASQTRTLETSGTLGIEFDFKGFLFLGTNFFILDQCSLMVVQGEAFDEMM